MVEGRWHVSDTAVKYDDKYAGALLFTARYRSVYGGLEEDALLDAKPVEVDECVSVSDVFRAPNPQNEPRCSVLYRLIVDITCDIAPR